MIRVKDERILDPLPEAPSGGEGVTEQPVSPPAAPAAALCDALPALVMHVQGHWGPETDRVVEETRAGGQGGPGSRVEVAQLGLAHVGPELVTVPAAELVELHGALARLGVEREALREERRLLEHARQASLQEQGRLRAELDAGRAERQRLEVDWQSARDEGERLRAGLAEMAGSLSQAQRDHNATCAALTREFEEAQAQWERARQSSEERLEAERSEHARQRTDAEQRLALLCAEREQARQELEAARREHAACLAEREQARQELEAARSEHASCLAGLSQELAAARSQGEQQHAALRAQRDGDREAHEQELRQLRNRFAAALAERDLTAERLAAVEAERAVLEAAAAGSAQRQRDLENTLLTFREEAEAARALARTAQEEVARLGPALEGAERRAQAAVAENRVLSARGEVLDRQIRERELALARAEEYAEAAWADNRRISASGAELQQQVRRLELTLSTSRELTEAARVAARRAHDDRIGLRQALAQEERRVQAADAENSRLAATAAALGQQVRDLEADLESARETIETARREHQDLPVLRQEREQSRNRAEELEAEIRGLNDRIREQQLEYERALETGVAAGLEHHQRLAAMQSEMHLRQKQAEAEVAQARGRFDEERQKLRDEITRLTSALADAERRADAKAGRSEELSQELTVLRAELHELRAQRDRLSANGRVHPIEVMTAAPQPDGRRSELLHSDGFRGAPSPHIRQGTEPRGGPERLPVLNVRASVHPALRPEASPSKAFPGEVDLALVRGQVEMLSTLLDNQQSSGNTLIYQQRLLEFTQKMREASRLANELANEVEQSRRRDEMQFHMYLLRRAEEIEKPRA